MDILDPRSLKAAAKERLTQPGCSHKKMALVYMGVSVLATVLVTLLQYFLDHQIGNTGGLSGMGTRAVLTTIQLVMQYVINIALPFWQLGFILIVLQLARGQRTETDGLLSGFRRFGPALRLFLTEGVLLMGAVLASSYAASMLFSMTPLALPFMERLTPMVENATSMLEIEEAILSIPADELWSLLKPVFVLMVIILPFPLVVLYLRFRMAPFVLMDSDHPGALMAMGTSRRITRHYRMKLLKLDLSFWWYYLLMGLATAVMYTDVLVKYIVVELPFSADTLSIIAYLAGSLLQLLIFWQLGGYVQTTQATAYDVLKANYEATQQAPPPVPAPQPMPQNLPWDSYRE